MSYAQERAIQSGYDSACYFRKEVGHEPYDARHPMFRYWWEAKVMKSDIPDYGLERIKSEVLQRVKTKG